MYEALGALGRVYLPTRKNGASAFLPYGEEGGEADLSLLLCDKSPKDLFFPQSEELVKFRLTGAEIALQEAARQKEPFVLFGVKACDLQAIEVLDRVFLAEPVDSFYQSRRGTRHRRGARLRPPGRKLLLHGLRHRPHKPPGAPATPSPG